MRKKMKNNVRCTFCGKDLGGFVFEHSCDKKVKNKELWNTKIGRRNRTKTEKILNDKIWTA